MTNPIPRYIVDQYNSAKKQGWIPYFRESASKYGFTTEDVMGVGSRESNLKNIKGDYQHGQWNGYSLMQLDIHSYRSFILSGDWKDVAKAIDKGCECLASKRDQIIKASKQKSASIKFRSGKTVKFTPKPFNDQQLRQMTLSAYNCGIAAYYHFSVGNDIDAGTTGKNYSRDVIAKSADFRDLLAKEAYGAAVVPRPLEPNTILAAVPPTPNADLTNPETDADDETAKSDANDAVVTPAPEADPDDFGKVQKVYENHADLMQNDTAKSIAAKASLKGGGLVVTIWGTTGGKIALTLTCLAVAGVLTWTIVKYRVRIKAFFVGVKNWITK